MRGPQHTRQFNSKHSHIRPVRISSMRPRGQRQQERWLNRQSLGFTTWSLTRRKATITIADVGAVLTTIADAGAVITTIVTIITTTMTMQSTAATIRKTIRKTIRPTIRPTTGIAIIITTMGKIAAASSVQRQ